MKRHHLFACALAVTGCGQKAETPSPPPATGSATSMAKPAVREWSREVSHYPGYPILPDQREWSHYEISQRHRNLVMRELPDYITDLRGGAPVEETKRTSAAWFFNVPETHREEFTQYLLDLGVPIHALRATYTKPEVEIPENHWPEKLADPPVESLLFLQSIESAGDTVIMGTKLGKSWDTISYYLTNLNYTRASILIRVSWKSGNVQICEKRAYDD